MTAESSFDRRNRYAFSLGTIGRDMLYALVSMYLLFYITDVLETPNDTLWWITALLFVFRFYDAINDPVMGVIVDNTHSRFGKFKPWIAMGAVLTSVFTVLFFTDFGLMGRSYVIVFAITYLLWETSYTANDIGYWSMLPSLTIDQKERERIGAMARNFANVGLFAVVVGIVPLTNALAAVVGSKQRAYFVFALIISVFMIAGQLVTLLGVREVKGRFVGQEPTRLRDVVTIIFKNDQLLYITVSMTLFIIGYTTTANFGLYFFKYAYRNEQMYAVFAAVLGLSQIAALLVFPLFSKRYSRRVLYSLAIAMIAAGYVLFFLAPMNIIWIGVAGILIFFGEAFNQLLMLVSLADTIEYGQWKLGRRNESVTFAVQPLIYKIGSAAASGIVGATVILSGINEAKTPDDVSTGGIWMMKVAMLLVPLVFIAAGFVVYWFNYKIDKAMYEKIVADLVARGQIRDDAR